MKYYYFPLGTFYTLFLLGCYIQIFMRFFVFVGNTDCRADIFTDKRADKVGRVPANICTYVCINISKKKHSKIFVSLYTYNTSMYPHIYC